MIPTALACLCSDGGACHGHLILTLLVSMCALDHHRVVAGLCQGLITLTAIITTIDES